MFTDKIEPIVSNGVANIGGNDLNQKGIDTVIWSLELLLGETAQKEIK